METAIRWNQRSNHSDPNFLVVDVIGRTFKHCRVTKSTSDSLQWQEVSRNSRAPAFRAFDWNFLYNVVAIGQWSGEANVLRLDNDSEALSLPIKSQRQCNAVAFSPETLLATGLERVRNDFCLNVYDIVHWVGSQKSHSLLLQQPPHEPIRKLATSEGITSIKFFQEQPNVLVAGVKGTCVRIYDLRENSGNPAIQYNTTCAHNLAVDPCDSNYFASAGAPKDSTVQVWDRRSAVRPPTTAPPSAVQFPSLDLPLLSFKDVFRSASDVETSSIWSLRYSIAQPGSLGVLGSNGSVRIFETKQPHADSELRKSYGDIIDESVQTVYVSRTETLGRPLYRPKRGSKDVDAEAERVLAFDFINVLSCNRRPSAIVFHGTQEIRLRELHPTVPTIANSHRNTIACNRSFGLAKSLKANTVLSGVTFLQPSQVGSISESRRKVLMKVENTKRLSTGIVPSPTSPSADGWAETDDDADDGWNEDQSSAQSSPTKVAARDAFPQERGKSLGMIEDALILADTSRRRCVEGYLFDAEKNAIIVQEETELQWMWNWIRGKQGIV
ncbi:hypothetical protein MMC10_008321 [Thelotrema lepadinum]|nr:hypothetical protein [Thelotrema lepadinum]